MTIQMIQYAVEIANTRSFSQASKNLFVTEPTLSQQIKKLETELGVQLFIRSTRTVQLTDAGETFVTNARDTLLAYQSLLDVMEPYKSDVRPIIHVGMVEALKTMGLQQLLQSLFDQFSEIKLRLLIAPRHALINDLVRGKLNYAILDINRYFRKKINTELLHIEPLYCEELYVLLSEGLVPEKAGKMHIQDLKDIPILIDGLYTAMHSLVSDLYQESGLSPVISSISTNDMDMLMSLVEKGQGYMIVGHSTAQYYEGKYSFCAVKLDTIEHQNNICLVYRKNLRKNKYDRAFINALKKHFAQLADPVPEDRS